MKISAISNNFNTPFQARIKVNQNSLAEKLKMATTAGTVATVGIASLADGALSFAALSDGTKDVHSIQGYIDLVPKDIRDSHVAVLTSAEERVDAAGPTGGIPVQSTLLPPGLSGSGVYALSSSSTILKGDEPVSNDKSIPS